jgi:hypothetical protein
VPLCVEIFGFDNVIGVRVVDEVLYFFTFSFVILILVLVVDFGFYIEENISPVPATLATVALSRNVLTVTRQYTGFRELKW